MEDVTGLFYQPKQSQPQRGQHIPKLDDWITPEMGNRIVISGVIRNHPNYTDGQRIVTSSIQGYKTNTDGSVYALTKRSRYSLGQRLSQYDADKLTAARHAFDKVLVPGKKTIC